MTLRKRKILLTQLSLLFFGILIIFYTYSDKKYSSEEIIISKEKQKEIEKQIAGSAPDGDVFMNIEYSGFDLAGNRYVLTAKEAYNNPAQKEIVNMKSVESFFYFKDNTILKVWSETGVYNNKTLDMIYETNVRATYEGSKLFAQKAEYSNLKSFLTITNNVKIKDIRGTMVADTLLFDIKKQTLNIASNDNSKINANIDLK